MVPWKVFLVALGGGLTLAAGWFPVVGGVPAPVVIVAAVLAGIAVMVGAHAAVQHADLFRGALLSERTEITRLVWLATLLHVGWVVTCQYRPELWIPLTVALVALSGLEYGAAAGEEWLLAKRAEKRAREAGTSTDGAGRPLDDVGKSFRRALDNAGHARVEVVDWEPIVDESGHVFGARFKTRIPEQQRAGK